MPNLGEATPAFGLQDAAEAAPPQVLTLAGGLQLPGYRQRTDQLEPQSIERVIVRLKLAYRSYGAPLQVPYIHSQHSRLK